MGLLGEGTEIGVYRGDFSYHILENWRGKKLHSIDWWKHQGRKLDRSDAPQLEHDENFSITKEILARFKNRSNILRERSIGASIRFSSKSLDFVYIDASHDYRSVWGDLEVWYPKIKNGGVIAGHDYKNSFVRKNLVEVKRAVDNYFQIFDLKVLTTTEDNIPSWWVIKK